MFRGLFHRRIRAKTDGLSLTGRKVVVLSVIVRGYLWAVIMSLGNIYRISFCSILNLALTKSSFMFHLFIFHVFVYEIWAHFVVFCFVVYSCNSNLFAAVILKYRIWCAFWIVFHRNKTLKKSFSLALIVAPAQHSGFVCGLCLRNGQYRKMNKFELACLLLFSFLTKCVTQQTNNFIAIFTIEPVCRYWFLNVQNEEGLINACWILTLLLENLLLGCAFCRENIRWETL